MTNERTRGNSLLAASPVDNVTPILRTLKASTRRKAGKTKKTRK